MKLNRVENTKRNIKYGLISKVTGILLPFVLRTLFIRRMGMEYAGLNNLFTSILQVLNLSELGFSNAIVFSMYKPIAENNDEEICALLYFIRRIYLFVGTFIFVIGICLMPCLPFLIGKDLSADVNVYIAFGLMLLDTSVSYLLFGYKNSLLLAYQRDDVIHRVNTIVKGIMYIFQMVVILCLSNYYLFIISMIVFTIINNLVINYEVKKIFPTIRCKGLVQKSCKEEIRKNTVGIFVTKICQVSRNSLDSVFISGFLGIVVAGIYSNYFYVMSVIAGLLSVLATSVLGGIGNSMQLNSVESNYEEFKEYDFAYMWMSGFCTVCLICLYQPFMNIWAGEGNLFAFSTVILLCLYFYIMRMGDIRGLYMQAAGLWTKNKKYAIIEAVFNLGLNYILGSLFGVNGIIGATILPLFCVNFVGATRIVFKEYFARRTREYYFFHIKLFIEWSIISIVTYCLCQNLVVKSEYLSLILRLIICVFVSNFLFIVTNFKVIKGNRILRDIFIK